MIATLSFQGNKQRNMENRLESALLFTRTGLPSCSNEDFQTMLVPKTNLNLRKRGGSIITARLGGGLFSW